MGSIFVTPTPPLPSDRSAAAAGDFTRGGQKDHRREFPELFSENTS